MKNTQLTTNKDRAERTIFGLICLTGLIGLLLIGALTSCKCKSNAANWPEDYFFIDNTLQQAGTPAQAERFLECAENEGDQGCDSCFYLVYGKHIDPYTGKVIETSK